MELADIPFVRMREELPQTLLNGRAKFSEVVAEAQKALPPLALCLHPVTHTVTAGGETFSLKPAEFAFYWLLAERCRQHGPGIHWSETDIEKELLDYYRRLVGEYSAQYEKAEETLKQGVTKEYFEPRKTKVNDAIKKALGERRAKPYLVVKLEKIPHTKYHRYGLALASDVVRVEG
ncbi:CRISPR-associated protein [Methylohalobius crimeensis]|uniref:CRISPR-associated protein n=1 Tax=Methylohalobius crimeensis TaxID=244365 RepID=UPI0003B5EDD4|nr:CRISPR-associated protein [Methylohalobius crimeensis]